jgi:hypothetical protein
VTVLDQANLFDGYKLIYGVVMSGYRYMEDAYCRLRVDEKESREAKLRLDFVGIKDSTI